MFFEIEFMNGVKRIIDSRGVMQYTSRPNDTGISIDGWGCGMEYFISSLSQGRAIVLGDWRKIRTEEKETINTVNIRTIKPVDSKLNDEMFREEIRIYEASQKRKREITKRVAAEIDAERQA